MSTTPITPKTSAMLPRIAGTNPPGVIASIPIPGRTPPGERLGAIPGVVPSLIGEMRGCAFRDRCPYAVAACAQEVPWRAVGGHGWRCVFDQLPAAAA